MVRKIAAIMLVVIVSINGFAFAHPGRVDENGGHYDAKTGEYHYHHGHPAHQHINGVCEFGDWIEVIIEDTGNSSAMVTDEPEMAAENNVNNVKEKTGNEYVTVSRVTLVLAAVIGILGLAYDIPNNKKIKSRRRKSSGD